MLEYGQFADYVHRYAQHHIEENSALESYCTSDYKVALEAEINSLVADRQVVISSIRNKDYIFVVPYFIEKYNDLFNQIDANISIPFPSINDMPKIVPIDVVTKKQAYENIYGSLDK